MYYYHFACFTFFVVSFIIFALTEIDQPRLLYFALTPRQARKEILYRRIVFVVGVWVVVGVLLYLGYV